MEIINLTKSYKREVFKNFNVKFNNETTAILGLSGAGKTTLLRIISGQESFSGQILNEKNISYVFQEANLIPNLTILENVSLIVGKEKALKYLKEVDLLEFKNYYPKQLSGGMAQRVNIARAFSYGGFILMDEPFKGLDHSLKIKLMNLYKDLQKKTNANALFVTHDVDEAMYLADRIIIFSGQPVEVVFDKRKEQTNREEILNGLK